MAPSEQLVVEALGTVQEPELHRDLMSLNMVRDLKIADDGSVELTVVLTTPACPLKAHIENEVRQAVMAVAGVTSVKVNFDAVVTSTPGLAAISPGIRNIIGVASGKGGVGKSTVSVNLALGLAKLGARVGLLDADIYGPNIPIMLGLLGSQVKVIQKETAEGPVDLMQPLEQFGLRIMSMGFLIGEDTPVIWRGPMLNSALRQFFTQVDWGELDYLIVDLPPGTGDVQISLIQLVKVTGIVQVTTPQAVALQDVKKGIVMFQSMQVPMLGVVENMSYFVSPGSGERTDIFGTGGGQRVAHEYGIRFLGAVPLAVEIREGGDTGEPVVLAKPNSEAARNFMAIAQQLAAEVSVQHFQREPEQAPA